VTVATAGDLTADEASEITGRIRAWVSDYPVADVKRAYFGRAWLAMGYESWQEWCAGELPGFKLPAVVRRDAVADLAKAGMSHRAIAEAAGVSRETVRRDVGGTNVPPEPITGQDGKTYKRKAKPVSELPVPGVEFQVAYENARESLAVLRAASAEYEQVNKAGFLLYKYAGMFRRARREMDAAGLPAPTKLPR
jgi:hypothetical protein